MTIGTAVPAPAGDGVLNTAHWIEERARERPFQRAFVTPRGRDREGRRSYDQVTFQQLERMIDRRAHALARLGVQRGERVVLLVPFGLEFVALVYALFKVGAVVVLIDPGMGPGAMVRCLEQVKPRGLVAIGKGHLALSLFGRALLRGIEHRVRVGGGLWRGGASLDAALEQTPDAPYPCAATRAHDVAALLFTSGSTGPAKGVVYEHATFEAQVRHLQRVYGIEPGEVDLPALPAFALFSVALGCTVVLPDMDFARPATLDPARFVEAISDHGVTYSFGSPAVWGPVAAHCAKRAIGLPSLRRVFMAGAPVPPRLHETLARVLPAGADAHTPYGATEALPVATITGRELTSTFAETRAGRGTCVGRPVRGIDVRIVRILDHTISSWHDDLLVPAGEVGEIVVTGDVVTKVYADLPEATAKAKLRGADGEVWHRMGDLGFLDAQGRLWFCGRKGHRVETTEGLLLTALEALFDEHPRVARCALVGVGDRPAQRPVLVVEALGGAPRRRAARDALAKEILMLGAANPRAAAIRDVLFHPSLPVDVRHNAKIRREVLAEWATTRVPT